MSAEKTFEGYLLVNWKTGEMRLRKTDPGPEASGYWIPIRLCLQLVVPEWEPTISARVELPEAKVRDIVTEVLEG